MSVNILFPSGTVVSDSEFSDGAGVPSDGLVSIGARPAPVANSPERLQVFAECADVYTRAQGDVIRLAREMANKRALWQLALDEYGVAIQVLAEARIRFRKACAGIHPDTGLTLS
jgi:hypothetical protein